MGHYHYYRLQIVLLPATRLLFLSLSISPAAIPGDLRRSPAAMAHRLLRDVEADGWERSDFPIICESCFGDNPYLRMVLAYRFFPLTVFFFDFDSSLLLLLSHLSLLCAVVVGCVDLEI